MNAILKLFQRLLCRNQLYHRSFRLAYQFRKEGQAFVHLIIFHVKKKEYGIYAEKKPKQYTTHIHL